MGGGRRGVEVVGAFSSASGGLDGLLGVGGACFGGRVNSIRPSDLHFGGANSSGAGAPFKTKYDKRDDFDQRTLREGCAHAKLI